MGVVGWTARIALNTKGPVNEGINIWEARCFGVRSTYSHLSVRACVYLSSRSAFMSDFKLCTNPASKKKSGSSRMASRNCVEDQLFHSKGKQRQNCLTHVSLTMSATF